jgi:hypothetical protein
MRGIESRVAKLEQEKGQARTVIVVVGSSDVDDEIARHLARWPEDAGRDLIVVNTGISRAPGDAPLGWCGAQ